MKWALSTGVVVCAGLGSLGFGIAEPAAAPAPALSSTMTWSEAIELARAKLPATLDWRRDALSASNSTVYETVVTDLANGDDPSDSTRRGNFENFLTQTVVAWAAAPTGETAALTASEITNLDDAIDNYKTFLDDQLDAMFEAGAPTSWPDQDVIDALSGSGSVIDVQADFVVADGWIDDPDHGPASPSR